MTRLPAAPLALLVALSAYTHSGCAGTPTRTAPAPAGSLTIYAITEESACYGATRWDSTGRTDLGWGDAIYQDPQHPNREGLSYRGTIVWQRPLPHERRRRAR